MTRELAFPEREYRERHARVRAEMGRRGLDVLYVMSPANLCYLTGFESIWYPPRARWDAVLARDNGQLVFSTTSATSTGRADSPLRRRDVLRYESALQTVVEAFSARGWTQGTVGIEWFTAALRRRR